MDIWFAPTDNLPRGEKLFDQDYPHLFDEPATWNTNIDVFQIPPYYAVKASDAELLRIASFLDRHHIALAVGAQSVQTNGECGPMEGLTRPRQNLGIFRRLKRIGLTIKYVGLDEPLTFGHYVSHGRYPCLMSIDEVAQRTAASLAEIQLSYPDVKFVDSEAPTNAPLGAWPTELAAWIEALKKASGTPLHAIVFDADWRTNWLDWVRPAVAVAQSAGVRAGMFLTIAGPGRSDASAVASLRDNIQAVHAARLPLDLTILACWTPYPTHSIPASDPNSLTSVLDWYLKEQGRPR